jgi:hypothetical protein
VPIDTNTPEGAAFSQLAKSLFDRQPRLDHLYSYYEGQPPLPEGMSNLRDLAYDFFRTSRTNFAELVAEAPRERMKPTGIRTSVDNDDAGDDAAWQTWTSAGLPIVSADVHQWMCVLGDGYAIVSKTASGRVVVTAEDPRQVITRHDPLTGDVVDALKIFRDEITGLDVAYMYRPGQVFVAKRTAKAMSPVGMAFTAGDWEWDTDLSVPLPAGFDDVVPVIRFQNRDGVGEYERHIDVLDRINRSILRGLVIMTYQAFKQRAIQGDLPESNPDGSLINYQELLKSGPDALWLLPPDAKIWESGQVDINPIISFAKNDVMFLSAVSRTPLPMLTPDGAAQSAEGATSQREGLVYKTEDRIARVDPRWSDVLSLVFRFGGDLERAKADQISLQWAPVQRYSVSERANAIAQTRGVVSIYQQLTEIWGMSPSQAERNISELQSDIILTAQMALANQQTAQPADPASTQAASGGA